jgi:hypothetical protein
MKRRRSIVLALLALPILGEHTNAGQSLVWKTEAELVLESEPTDCLPDDEECQNSDHVSYVSRSHYGRKYFLTYEEASRAYVSFDASLDDNHDVQFVFALEQIAPGAFDWGGIEEHGTFKPLYVVKRFYDPEFDWSQEMVDRTKYGLLVWRLSSDNPKSATVLISDAGLENAKARLLAEADYTNRK